MAWRLEMMASTCFAVKGERREEDETGNACAVGLNPSSSLESGFYMLDLHARALMRAADNWALSSFLFEGYWDLAIRSLFLLVR